MQPKGFIPGDLLKSTVRNIEVYEATQSDIETLLPFYADGFPGIVFTQSLNGVFLRGSELPGFFLYGQTLEPIELSVKGQFRMIVFYLYPYTVNKLFELEIEKLTDNCFDLLLKPGKESSGILDLLQAIKDPIEQVDLISDYLLNLSRNSSCQTDLLIEAAITRIIKFKGKISIKQLRDELHMAERTFERQFSKQVGISPKLFARIIQFQSSLNQLNTPHLFHFSDIVYENGFADQSHFIRTFKKFTGKKPLGFRKMQKAVD